VDNDNISNELNERYRKYHTQVVEEDEQIGVALKQMIRAAMFLCV
jgi:hypothetical protein